MLNEKLKDSVADILDKVADSIENDDVSYYTSEEAEEKFFSETKIILEGKTAEELAELLQMSLYMNVLASLYAPEAEEGNGVVNA